MDIYGNLFTDLDNNTIRDGSKLLDVANQLSLLAMMAYSYKEDVDLDEWMTEYAKNNNFYYPQQKENYLYMKQDFDRFTINKEKKSA